MSTYHTDICQSSYSHSTDLQEHTRLEALEKVPNMFFFKYILTTIEQWNSLWNNLQDSNQKSNFKSTTEASTEKLKLHLPSLHKYIDEVSGYISLKSTNHLLP